jgi:hypothetical protein
MDKALYFIGIVAEALRQPDPDGALRQAFAEIETRGRQSDYAQGYRQYQHFMSAVADARENLEALTVAVRQVILALADHRLAGATAERALTIIGTRSEWLAELAALRAELAQSNRPQPLTLALVRSDVVLRTITLDPVPGRWLIANVVPGEYALVLGSGRVLWEGRLRERDLIWRVAFPRRPLDLAADTGEGATPTLMVPLLDGTLTMRVFPGLESGRIEIAAMAR